MIPKPTSSDGYGGGQLGRVRQTCIYMATKLGDLLDEIVVVGGLVPYFLIDQKNLPSDLEPHAGTMDLDMGLALAILNQERYRELGVRLRGAGFQPDVNELGNKRLQSWTTGGGHPVAVDFLIPPIDETGQGGTLFHIEADLAAIVTPGLELAFKDRCWKELSGITPSGARATETFRYAVQAPSPSSKPLPFTTGRRTKTLTTSSTFGEGLASPRLQSAWLSSCPTPTSTKHCPLSKGISATTTDLAP